MIIVSNLNSEEFRYERKYLTDMMDFPELVSRVKMHPSAFKEIHEERRINNIYLDYEDLKNYKDSVEGNRERLKVRIRWYGETFDNVKPVLEIKIKDGLQGKKMSFPLASFVFYKDFSNKELWSVFSRSNLPSWVLEKLKSYKMVLLNNYKRRYFLSGNKKVRMTLDYDQEFYELNSGKNRLNTKVKDSRTLVIELNHIARLPPKIRNYKSYPWKQFTCMPFNLSDHSARLVPTGSLILKTIIKNDGLFGWSTHGTSH